ncbi:MAG: tetratricopeptide repeat protein [Hyphomicrobiales bacterium]|nr:tetratricopeptide repeat protein [Hyphomicrobiales bacterium]
MRRGALAGILLIGVLTAAAADDLDTCTDEIGDVAIAACTRVIDSPGASKENRAQALINRGQEYYSREDYDRAIDDATRAIEVAASKVQVAYSNRGNAWAAKGDSARAIADYTRALKIDPKFPAPHTGRGLQREKTGDLRGALADFRAALALRATYDDGEWAHEQAREGIARIRQLRGGSGR